MAEMAMKLKRAADRCKLLEKEERAEPTDLKKAVADAKDTRSVMRAAKEELREAGEITAGKPFMLRRKCCDPKHAPLDQLWSPTDTYLDLAASVVDATEHFRDQEDR